MAGSRPGIRESVVHGWAAVHLSSDLLEVTVLPDKGADIYALTDLASGIDSLFKAPWGLQPPGSPPRAGSDGAADAVGRPGHHCHGRCRFHDSQ